MPAQASGDLFFDGFVGSGEMAPEDGSRVILGLEEAGPSSIATARTHTRLVMEKWGLPAAIDDAELIASELTTNAIKATKVVLPQAQYPEIHDRLEMICLCLFALNDGVLIEVWDPEREPPCRREVSPDDEGGRGLLLVEYLATDSGTRWPSTGGKIVWAKISCEISHN